MDIIIDNFRFTNQTETNRNSKHLKRDTQEKPPENKC